MGFLNSFFKRSGKGFVNNQHFRLDEPELLKFVTFNEEYASELSLEAAGEDQNNSYSNSGVRLTEIKETQDMLKLSYNGLLAKSGAMEIYSVIGYGDNQNWENTTYFPMKRVDSQSFELIFPSRRSGNINIAFKDGIENWDNNSGKNYSFYDRTVKRQP